MSYPQDGGGLCAKPYAEKAITDHACYGRDPQLFDSVKPADHLLARAICGTCPRVQSCLRLALSVAGETGAHAQRGPDGTWGGLLWRDGRVIDPKRAETWRHTHHKRSA